MYIYPVEKSQFKNKINDLCTFHLFSLLISTLKGHIVILQKISRSNERNRLVYKFSPLYRGEDSLLILLLVMGGRYRKCKNAFYTNVNF